MKLVVTSKVLLSSLILATVFIHSIIAAVGTDCSVSGTNGNCGENEECVSNACTCSAGYHDTDGDKACNACGPGTYKSGTGQDACTQVKAGYYAVSTSGARAKMNVLRSKQATTQ